MSSNRKFFFLFLTKKTEGCCQTGDLLLSAPSKSLRASLFHFSRLFLMTSTGTAIDTACTPTIDSTAKWQAAYTVETDIILSSSAVGLYNTIKPPCFCSSADFPRRGSGRQDPCLRCIKLHTHVHRSGSISRDFLCAPQYLFFSRDIVTAFAVHDEYKSG